MTGILNAHQLFHELANYGLPVRSVAVENRRYAIQYSKELNLLQQHAEAIVFEQHKPIPPEPDAPALVEWPG